MRHPERLSDPKAFSFKVEGTFNSCLDRQVREGVLITYGEADEIMNSKTEYHQGGREITELSSNYFSRASTPR